MIPDLVKEFDEYGEYVIWNFSYEDDGYGSQIPTWRPGAKFNATVKLDDSVQMKIAEAQGVKGIYRVVTQKNIMLPWHTVFKSADGRNTYRITSKKGSSTPSRSLLDMQYHSAEEYEIIDDTPPT